MFIHQDNQSAGKTIVLLHGQVLDSRLWQQVVPSLEARVLRPDMPGYGQSAGELVGDFPSQHDRLEAALLPMVQGRSVHLVGHSSGSYQAIALALRGRLQVESITMLGPWAGGDAQVLASFAGLVGIVERKEALWLDIFMGNSFSAEFFKRQPATVAAERARASTGPLETFLQELRLFPGMADLRPRLAELDCPVLVRQGELDIASTVSATREFFPNLKNGTLEIVPGAGHHLLVEDFEATVASLKRFTGC